MRDEAPKDGGEVINEMGGAPMRCFAVFSAPTNGLLWLGPAATVEDAVRGLNREAPIADTEPSEAEDFLLVVPVNSDEAERIEALEWGAPLPELAARFTEVSYSVALALVASQR